MQATEVEDHVALQLQASELQPLRDICAGNKPTTLQGRTHLELAYAADTLLRESVALYTLIIADNPQHKAGQKSPLQAQVRHPGGLNVLLYEVPVCLA